MNSTKLLIGATGSVGVFNIPTYLYALRSVFSEIQVIMTESSQQFISQKALSMINKNVHTNLFSSELNHIQLARWADIFIVFPTTAHTLAQVANGFAGTLLTTVILAHSKPILFFPNMNDSMWNNPATQRNVRLVKEFGHQVVMPINRMGYEHASMEKSVQGYLHTPHELIEILLNESTQRKLGEPCSTP